MPRNPNIGPVVAPAEATHWALWQAHPGDSRKSRGTRYTRCQWPDPQPDASILELFPVAEFSTALILGTWGAGRYRIDFYDAAGAQLKGKSRTISVANPREREAQLKAPNRRRGRRTASDAADPDELPTFEGVPIGADGKIGLLEVVALMRESDARANERAQQAADRARQDAERAAERDRQFLQMVLGTRGGGGSLDYEAVMREVRLSIRENMLAIRQDLNLVRESEEPEGEPGDPPADLPEALERMGLSALGELEEQAPGFIKENVPKFLEWLKLQANGGRAHRG